MKPPEDFAVAHSVIRPTSCHDNSLDTFLVVAVVLLHFFSSG